jgi:hypothetical protein
VAIARLLARAGALVIFRPFLRASLEKVNLSANRGKE